VTRAHLELIEKQAIVFARLSVDSGFWVSCSLLPFFHSFFLISKQYFMSQRGKAPLRKQKEIITFIKLGKWCEGSLSFYYVFYFRNSSTISRENVAGHDQGSNNEVGSG
jgi:hypothetical protein